MTAPQREHALAWLESQERYWRRRQSERTAHLDEQQDAKAQEDLIADIAAAITTRQPHQGTPP